METVKEESKMEMPEQDKREINNKQAIDNMDKVYADIKSGNFSSAILMLITPDGRIGTAICGKPMEINYLTRLCEITATQAIVGEASGKKPK